MKKIIAFIIRIISQISGRKKPDPIPCQFCGETGHDSDECPKSAKFKLFDIDRE